MTTESIDPRRKLELADQQLRVLLVNTKSLRLRVQELERLLVQRVSLTVYPSSRLDTPSFSASEQLANIQAQQQSEHRTARALLDLLESSAEYKKAIEIIAPILEQVAEIELVESEADTAAAQARAALEQAHAAAIAEAQEIALAKAMKSPTVTAAKTSLEIAEAKAASLPRHQ